MTRPTLPRRRLRFIAAAAIALALSACATASQPYLDEARTQCAQGSTDACHNLPLWEATVAREHQERANAVAAGSMLMLGAAAAGAAAGYAASHPVYYPPPVVVVCRWGCY